MKRRKRGGRKGSWLRSKKVRSNCGGGKWKRKGFRSYLKCGLKFKRK